MIVKKFLVFKLLDEEHLLISRSPRRFKRTRGADDVILSSGVCGITIASVACPEISNDIIYINGSNIGRDSQPIELNNLTDISEKFPLILTAENDVLKGRIFL